MGQFLDQNLWDDVVEGRAEVQREHPHVADRMLQIAQCGVERYGDSVLIGTVCPVGKLVGVQSGRQTGPDVLGDQFLEVLHDHRRKCYRPVVNGGVHCCLLGDGDDGGGLEAGWDGGQGQG